MLPAASVAAVMVVVGQADVKRTLNCWTSWNCAAQQAGGDRGQDALSAAHGSQCMRRKHLAEFLGTRSLSPVPRRSGPDAALRPAPLCTHHSLLCETGPYSELTTGGTLVRYRLEV